MDDREQDSILRYMVHQPDGAADLTLHFKPGRPSEHPLGVMYHAPWETPFDGFAEHSRRCARALALTGCPVHLRSLTPHLVDDPEEHALQRAYADLVQASIARYSVQVHQLVPTETALFGLVRHRYLNEHELAAVNRLRVLSTVWERSPIPESAVDAMNQVGQNWVACEENAGTLAEWGVTTPIRVIPIPFFDDDPHLKLRGRARKPGPPRFYHIGKWEPRKAQDQILGAFLRAFKPGEAELYLKTSAFASNLVDYPEPMTCAHGWLRDPAVMAKGWTTENLATGLKIFAKKIAASQLVALHGLGDIYVTLSRGEGFDMAAFDSQLAGNAMVWTPSGGPQDFAHSVEFLVEPRGRIPCHPFYKWREGAEYLDFSLDVAVDAMQRAAAKLGRHEVPSRGLDRFRAATVGKKMLTCLGELADPVF